MMGVTMTPIITSILDLDLYKLTVGQFVFFRHRFNKVTYEHTVRNAKEIKFWDIVPLEVMREQILSLMELSATKEEAAYLLSLGFDPEYIAFLSDKPMKGCEVCFLEGLSNIVVGDWAGAMLFEVFVCAIGNELFYRGFRDKHFLSDSEVTRNAKDKLNYKIGYYKTNADRLGECKFTEFGTRRRINKEFQRHAVEILSKLEMIDSTSNVLLAKELGLKPVGTQGHELYMGLMGIYNPHIAQKMAIREWSEYWDGKYDIFLDDTMGSPAFYKDAEKKYMVLAKGFRHDSGDEEIWLRNNYRCLHTEHRLTPEQIYQKIVMFTNGLDFERMFKIRDTAHRMGYLNPRFGIGTYITNDTFIPVPQSVMKIVSMNGFAVMKASNDAAKTQCANATMKAYLTENLVATL